MSRRGENIHKRKDGRWEARFPKERDENGKIVYASVYGKSYREAKEKALLAAADSQSALSGSAKESSFGEVLEMWLDLNRVHWKGATVRKYQYIIERHILPELGKYPVSQLSNITLNSFLRDKQIKGRVDSDGGLSSSYIRSMAQIISSVLGFAIEEELCSSLKIKIIKPMLDRKEVMVLSPAEQKRLESNLLSNVDPTHTGILLALRTGLRIGEVCALSWNDIDLTRRTIRIRHTLARVSYTDDSGKKGSKWLIDTPKTRASLREIPIPSAVWHYLEEATSKSQSEYAASSESSYVNPRTFEYRYHKVLEECGIASIHFHALRHTFATRCIEAGVDIKSLSEMLGHANVSITLNTYVHSSMELKRLQLEKVSAFAE